MKIKTLNEKDFTKFASNHKYHNFYQTTNYGNLMKNNGFDTTYLGFYNNSNVLIGASLILYKKIFTKYKFAYAPNGFLIDYSDEDIISDLTLHIKKLLLKQDFIFIKIDPLIHCSERDEYGKLISFNPEINNIMEILSKNGYKHHGFNKFFENLKPRWNAVTKLTVSNDKLYYELNKQTRNKINKANKYGVEVHKGSIEDLPIFYNFIKNKHSRKYEYYLKLFEEFEKDDNIELYLSTINTEKYVRNSKLAYEKELDRNENLSKEMNDIHLKGKDVRKVLNKKMESDKIMDQEQNNLLNATQLFQEYPDGLVIGGAIMIKNGDSANLLIEGFDKKYNSFNPNYLLKWEIIKHYNELEYKSINLNAIVGEFYHKNKYSGLNEMKLGFNAHAVEYIGEFDYIINKPIYKLYELNLLNKPSEKIKERYK